MYDGVMTKENSIYSFFLSIKVFEIFPKNLCIINMTSWMGNHLAKVYNAVSGPVAATRDAITERLQSVCETASILYNKMMENMEYGRQILKDIGEKEAREEEAEEEQQQDDEEYDTLQK